MRSIDFRSKNGSLAARRSRLAKALTAALLLIACSNATDAGTDAPIGAGSSMPGAAGSTVSASGSAHAGAPAGGAVQSGGAADSGGAPAVGGRSNAGGTTSIAGAGAAAGSSPAAGSSGMAAGVGGAAGIAGASVAGAGGESYRPMGPCDIYAGANTPCVSAHSTVRALYGTYSGALYQVRRASDKATKDVPVLAAGGVVDVSVQDTFCSGTTCTISILYDQSPNKNDLVKSPVAHWLPNGGVEANAANAKITVSGHTAHGIYVTANSNVAYRNNSTKGVAKGDQPEAMYMVVDGKRYNDSCCFDYGNAETTGNDDGNGTMEAVYWGSDITWGGHGEGSGPWVAADLENGVFKGNKGGWKSQSLSTPSAKSVIATYATAMLKGPSGNHFTLKAGSAQSGSLLTMWDGTRPTPSYSPKKLQGAIILGTGGDGSNTGTGTFFEGAITSGTPADSVDDAIQANIIAAGYGR